MNSVNQCTILIVMLVQLMSSATAQQSMMVKPKTVDLHEAFDIYYGDKLSIDQFDSVYSHVHHGLNSDMKSYHDIYCAKWYSKKGLQKRALQKIDSLKFLLRRDDHDLWGHCYHTLGNIAMNSENPDQAAVLYKQSLMDFRNAGNSSLVQAQYINLGRVYDVLKSQDSSRYFYQLASDMGQISDINTLCLKLNQALSATNSGDMEKAKKTFKEALPLFQESQIQGRVRTFGNLADIYFKQDSLDMAESYYLEGKNLAEKSELKTDLFRLNRSLSKLYEKRDNFKSAYKHYTRSDSIRQSFNLSAVDKQLYKSQEAILNKRIAEKKRKPSYLSILLGVAVCSLLVFSLIWYVYRQRPKKEVPPKAVTPFIIDDKAKATISRLEVLIYEKQAYKQNKLSLNSLAKKLKTNRSYLSELINAHYQKSFSQWINEVRIQEARRMLSDDSSRKYSIQGISSIVGFSSISAFNTNFKAQTGLTPSNYRDKS